MKKVLALLTAIIILVGVCGCSSGNDKEKVRGEITTDPSGKTESTTDTTESEPEFSLGATANNTYKNDFLGISCTLPSEWVFYTDEQILEINNMVGDIADDELLEQMKKADIIYDMYASNEVDGSNMNVNLQKISAVQALTLDMKQSLEAQIDNIKSTYQNMGYTDINVNYQLITVGGKEFDSLNVTAKIQGIDFYSRCFSFKKGNYIANVTVGSLGTDKTETILSYFSVK